MNVAVHPDLGSQVITAPHSQPSVSASVRPSFAVITSAQTVLSRQNLV